MTFRPRCIVSFIAMLLVSAATFAPGAAARVTQVAQVAQKAQDAQKEGIATGFDSIWTGAKIPTQPPTELERVMLSDDKILVVLGVVLIIWFGIISLILRNDRRIGQLERELENHRSDF